MILWSGLMAAFGLYLQSRCARYLDRGTASFFALSQITYPNAAVIFDAAIAIKCFGVGVSYLIIIGDLMPGVVVGFNEGAAAIPFLVDRHFWVTAFMYVNSDLAYLTPVAHTFQACCDSTVFFATLGLLEIYKRYSIDIHRLPGNNCCLPFRERRHYIRTRTHQSHPLGRPGSCFTELSSGCVCIYMPSKCKEPQCLQCPVTLTLLDVLHFE